MQVYRSFRIRQGKTARKCLEVMEHMLRYRIGHALDAVAAPLRRIFPHTRHDIDMVNGSIFSNVVRFSIPLILSGMLQLLYNMADVVVVGQFEDHNAVAAVGATSSLITLMVNLFIGLSVGTSVLVAQYIGAGKYREVQDTVHTSVTLSLVLGVVVGVFGLFMSRTFLEMMDTPAGAVLDGASLYMRIYFLGLPGNMLYNFGAAVMRAVGDTKRPLYYLSLAGVINIVFNIITVAFFGMGVAGVAIATIISQYISAILVTLNLMRSQGSVHLDLKRLRIRKQMLGGILRVGLPAGLSSALFSISNVLIQSSINSFGANAIAGSTGASQLESFVYVSMNSISQAALSFTGQNIGAQKYERVNKVMRICLLLVVAAGLFFGILVTLFSEPLLHLFINADHDPTVIADVVRNGQIRMRIICTMYFLDGAMEVLASMLRGMGSSIAPTLVTVVGICGLRMLWIWTVFAANHTLDVLYLSYPISWTLTTIILGACYFYTHKKLMRNAQTPLPAAA